ncbi:unnamed protein product [Rotaria magnacalcarata]|uniref:Uncharacterized protein n=2 Tax=Rotaria magnacalcarata TaxID=392030 RepID=A0A820FU68_9BILA|nr:unnamed protein product [Rotaria magnacalcarata]CAF1419585.1 unnamed protein product [Rotaria magnacalcarata]CAF2072052.1 unnamed protein product [Rotaria magnacalcarata]CAF2100145.1 unnamed protein product [Rotaria magnacalcarata]CAF4049067.1 unnamed protein product [Rotaria magnacalcarata]
MTQSNAECVVTLLMVFFLAANYHAEPQYTNISETIECINAARPYLILVKAGVTIQGKKGIWADMDFWTSEYDCPPLLLIEDADAKRCQPAVYNCVYKTYIQFKKAIEQIRYTQLAPDTLTIAFFVHTGSFHSYSGNARFSYS